MLFAGVDAGGTSTRVAVHTASGERVGYGTAGSGNPAAHGHAAAACAINAALRAALDGLAPSAVAATVAGVSGADDGFADVLARLWTSQGLPCAPRMLGDVDVAYAAGTPSPTGTLLLSGTGAAAARMVGRQVDAVADGLGWLLGDEGSGFWIGHAAVRSSVHALDAAESSASLGPLAALVVRHYGVSGTPRRMADQIVRHAQADRMTVAAAAPLAGRAALLGDPVARSIVRQAAQHLATTAARVHRDGPIVLAGSVLTSHGPVRLAVQELLEEGEVLTAQDGAGGAAWLAALPHVGEEAARATHHRFVTPSPLQA
ncbi:BadF/BadG/BcrA/BcrD ATPase family protein [Nonomuraea sp. NPDC005983]|uniref:N-acetylglucosamine kinase n=1 Tax=Nonomuraea sp. NPDC005983 TaxID=3155595 RepID=UPI0033B6EA44